jgi:hypothetical protein
LIGWSIWGIAIGGSFGDRLFPFPWLESLPLEWSLTDLLVLTDATPLSLWAGKFLARLESEMEMPWLELEFFPSNGNPFIFFPLAVELLSPSEFLLFTISFFLLRLESDEGQPDGTTSDIELHLRFLKPILLAPALMAWTELLDPIDIGEATRVSWLRSPVLWWRFLRDLVSDATLELPVSINVTLLDSAVSDPLSIFPGGGVSSETSGSSWTLLVSDESDSNFEDSFFWGSVTGFLPLLIAEYVLEELPIISLPLEEERNKGLEDLAFSEQPFWAPLVELSLPLQPVRLQNWALLSLLFALSLSTRPDPFLGTTIPSTALLPEYSSMNMYLYPPNPLQEHKWRVWHQQNL